MSTSGGTSGGGGPFPTFSGSGSPEGTQAANQGAWYLDRDTGDLYNYQGTDGNSQGWCGPLIGAQAIVSDFSDGFQFGLGGLLIVALGQRYLAELGSVPAIIAPTNSALQFATSDGAGNGAFFNLVPGGMSEFGTLQQGDVLDLWPNDGTRGVTGLVQAIAGAGPGSFIDPPFTAWSSWAANNFTRGSLVVGAEGDLSVVTDAASVVDPFTVYAPGSATDVLIHCDAAGSFYPVQAPTVSAPPYAEGGMYYDTTLKKLRIGGAAAWETVTSA